MRLCVVILCLCLASRAYASGNILKDPYICGAPTCAETEKFKYLLDTIYHYEYTVNIETYFAGSSNNRSTLNIRTVAKVQFITRCEGLLQLSDVTLVDQDENYPVERAEKFIHALSLYDLRFAFHDGIVSEICPETGEEDWVLNFKRGVLSLLQNSMKRFDINFKGIEQDVHGTCSVDYTIRGQKDTSLILVKTRDLAQCTDRYKYMSILQTVRYNFQSKYQTWPVLKSDSKCVITIDHNVYTGVNCRERHLFEPFSGKNSGAMSTVIQDLRLLMETNKTDAEFVQSEPKTWNAISRRSNLLHQHSTYITPSTLELKSAREILISLCELKDSVDGTSSVNGNMDGGSAVGLWGRLVRSSRGLHHLALAQLLVRAPTICDRAKKHILDALPYIASVGSVQLIKDMILNNEVDAETKHEWLMSVAMIPRPKVEMLESILELLLKDKNDKVISFTASSMVHSYCKQKSSLRECCEEDVPRRITEVFQDIVHDVVKNDLTQLDRTSRNNIIYAIKALGNIGGFKPEFADVLINMVGDETAPVPLRLAAIDAFRRTPCTETREYFLEIYRSNYINIEVRLASYLQVMKCPNLSIIRKIFHSLDNEKVNQAATFVWSHLNNLGQSSLPSRVEIQGLLSGNPMPQLEDSPDFRMFSRNYEQSVFFDQYNAGGNYEANVVFSPDSYIPRSLGLNLTVDMFGESINLLELKGRIEGFERYFEGLFGNSGPLSKDNIRGFFDKWRDPRSVNDADGVRRKADGIGYKSEALKHRYPTAELGVRVFGNEISHWSVEGDDEITKAMMGLNPQFRILEILSGKEISYHKASLFLDTTFSVPTGCGLPLNMNLMGTSYTNTNLSGTVNDKMAEEGSLKFQGNVRPSVALNIAATMTVAAGGLTSSGIRVNMRLYTATALSAHVTLSRWSALKISLSLPRQRQEIFAAESELIVLHGETELQQQGLNPYRIEQNTCSWSMFDKAIGVKVCAAYQFPDMSNLPNAPYFILSGPAKYRISLEKADPSANTYVFEYVWDKNETSDVVSFAFNTPDSQQKRLFNATLSMSNSSSTALVELQAADTILKAQALYRNLEYDKSLQASLTINGKRHFDSMMSLTRQNITHGFVWLPAAYWIVNDEKVAELSGTVQVKSKGGVTQLDINGEFQTRQLASRLIGYYTINGPTHGTKLQLDYAFNNNPKQMIKIEGIYSERSLEYRHDIYGELSMDFSAYSMYNFYAVLRKVILNGHLDIGFNVSSSRETKTSPSLSFTFNRMEKLDGMKVDTQLILTRPAPIRIKYYFEEIGAKYVTHALLNFNPKSRDIVVSGYLYYPPDTQLYLNAELNMTLPTLHPCVLMAKVHEKQPNEFQVNAFGVWFTGTDFNVDAMYQDQSKTNMAAHRVKLLLTSSKFNDVALDARYAQDNRQITFVGAAGYNEKTYKTLLRYILISEKNFSTYGELSINDEVYSVNLNADLNNNTNVNMDIHFKEVRDIHISYQHWSTELQKRLSATVDWDVNRDPSQRISVDAQLDNKGAWHRSGHAMLFYPGRVINGEFEFLLKDWFCQWHVLMGWSQESRILWGVKMYSEVKNETIYALNSLLNTPFDGWSRSSLNAMWRYHDNLQAIEASMNKEKDYFSFNLFADYLLKSDEIFGEFIAEVNSTIPAPMRGAAMAKHHAIWKKSADTLIKFQYSEEGLMLINSSWSLDRSDKENNITGMIKLTTPFQGYKSGHLRTHFVIGHKRDINGITFMSLEEKLLKIYVNGHMRRITNCMLVINATSPAVNEVMLMSARFGFVEADRHLVAMIVTPTTTTGIEILLQLHSMQNFDVYGHIALPLQYLNRVMVKAQRSSEQVDFRVGWGKMDLGFTGIWHWQTMLNFVYLYKLYTPLEGFEENGLVLKNIYGNGLDTELSVRLSTHKFGIAILMQDNGKGLLDVIKDRFQRDFKYGDMFVENFDTIAHVTLDTLYYPTITFHSHLMKFFGEKGGDILEANATLNLPGKEPIVLTDLFILEEYTVMQNKLKLTTPFEFMRILQSVYNVDIVIGEKLNISCLIELYNGTHWHETSFKVYHEYESGEDDTYQSHVASLGIVTPLVVLPKLEAAVNVRLEDTLWKMSGDVLSPHFVINATGRLELDETFVDTSGSLNLASAYLEDYFIKMEFKKDFSEVENTVGGGILIQQGEHNNYLFAEAVWRLSPSTNIRFKSRGALHPVLLPTVLTLVYSGEQKTRSLTVDMSNDNKDYSLQADQRPNSISVALSTPHEGYRAIKIIGELDNKDHIRGTIISDSREYAIAGNVINKEPFEMSLMLVPKGSGDRINIRVKVDSSTPRYGLSAHFTGGLLATLHAQAQFETNYTDIFVKLDQPQSVNKELYLKTRVDLYDSLRRVLVVQAVTPFAKLKEVKANADFVFGPKSGYLLGAYDLPDMKGGGDLRWSFVVGDLYIRAVGNQHLSSMEKSVDLDIYFGNKTAPDGLTSNNAGFRMDLDRVWQIGANASFGYIFNERLALVINALLPRPNVDVHSLNVDLSMGTQNDPRKTVVARYKTDVTKIITGLEGDMLYLENVIKVNASAMWTSEGYKSIDNRLEYRWDGNESHFLDYALKTPFYQNEETLTVKGSYQKDFVHEYQIVKGIMHRPSSCQIGELDVRYGGLKHTDGHFNITTPFERLPWLRSIFNINNKEEHSDNKVDIFWPDKWTTLNTTHHYEKLNDGFRQNGVIALAIPLSTRHIVNTQYNYVHGDKQSNGNATIDFDNNSFVKSSFKQLLDKSQRNLDLATSHIEVENAYAPVGVKYIHEYDVSGNIDVKQATVFHLHNETRFNLTGIVDVSTFETGKNIKLTGIHGNRTLILDNQYEAVDRELKQGSKIKWAENTWIQYDVHVTNMSAGDVESQRLIMNVKYPLRTFNLLALYNLQDTLLNGSAKLVWNVRDENKTAELKGKWENPPVAEGTLNDIDLSLAHPSFRKDVTLKGQYLSTPSVMSNLSLELQYSDYDNEYLRLKSLLTDNSNGPIRDYKFALVCTHPSTNLDLEIDSDIRIHSRWYYINDYYRFQKTLFTKKLKHNKIIIDMNNSLVKYERANETYFTNINGTWNLTYPEYRVITKVERPTGHDIGVATLYLNEKRLVAHYNSTDDISYHMIGYIPDTRSARLDAWRNYDDVTTVDIASYLRLNHSRLLTGSFVWRPLIFSEIKSSTVYTLKTLYGQINETLVILKEAPMEAHSALKNIWSDAEPRIRDLLDDLNDLHVVREDLDEFHIFLNNSYNNNDFYVKDIVEFTYYILDEMAIKNHLENLPGFVNDMWGIMGNTSQSIKQSLTSVFDTIKNSYNNFLETVNKFLETDLMQMVSARLEAMIMQYDNFIRDVHMKILDFWEKTWVNTMNHLAEYWHQILRSIEPLLLDIIHYTESTVVAIWKKVMDFFYNSSKELTESTYFNYVATFGHEVDKIYKDLLNEDLLTNVKKYSVKFWNVIWSKIEPYIPFKDEIMQLYLEFKNAWENFMKTPQVVYVIDKIKDAYSRLKWWYDYFLIGETLNKIGEILYNKLSDMAKTALQYEEIHRTPKTNFIFDPRKGEILLEQKLPMSWHAFNQTPDFTEISEYKAVRSFIDNWLVTNKTLWSYYYAIRPYMEINNVLPPFAGIAIMTGQGTLVTFDKVVFTISETGTFLLSRDYRQNNFTLFMESNDQGRYNLVLLTKKNLIHIDLYKEQVSISEDSPLTLPSIVEDWVVDRHTETITISGDRGLHIECNLLFHTCKLEVSGWHYSNLGGLLGTYNNEQFDDMQLPNCTLTNSVNSLGHSWNIEASQQIIRIDNQEPKNDTQCDKFFQNKVSPLHPCFSVVNAERFLMECLSGVDSCALANAYMQICAQQHVPTRIPDQCMQCTTKQGDTIEEGSFYELKDLENSTDVVFLIETNYCNMNLRKSRNMDLFVESFDIRLQSSGLTDNRYAVVMFGGGSGTGKGLYSKPRALYVDNKLFTDSTQISHHFDKLYIDKSEGAPSSKTYPVDMFSALSFATELDFRLGVQKTFVLMPCANAVCDSENSRLDYSTIYHNLIDNSVTLHILMDDELMLAKRRASKYLFGVDITSAYTTRDYEKLVGDQALRKQVKLPKDTLGLCTSLALETNGTILAGKKLRGGESARTQSRRFGSVAGARAAISASASRACIGTHCECRDARLHCAPCLDTRRLMELSFWNTDEFDDFIDIAKDTPLMPTFS